MATTTSTKRKSGSKKTTATKKSSGASSTRRSAAVRKTARSAARPKAKDKNRDVEVKPDVNTGTIPTPFDTPLIGRMETREHSGFLMSPVVEEISLNIATIHETGKDDAGPDHHVAGADGETGITRELLARITLMSIDEIDGLEPARNDGISRFLSSFSGRINGIRVEKGTTEVAVDILVRVRYGANIPDLAAKLRETVGRRIWQMTGMRVVEANVRIQDVSPVALSGETD